MLNVVVLVVAVLLVVGEVLGLGVVLLLVAVLGCVVVLTVGPIHTSQEIKQLLNMYEGFFSH